MNTEIEVIKAVAEHLGLAPEELDRNASLRDDLTLGPLELNDLLEALQQKFKVTLEERDLANVQTVNDLIVLIEDNQIA